MHRSGLLFLFAIVLVGGLLAWTAGRDLQRPSGAPESMAAVAPAPAAPSRPVATPASALEPGADGAAVSRPAPEREASSVAAAKSGDEPATDTERAARSQASSAPAGVTGAPGTAGHIAAIDPETGEITLPSAEQLRELFPPGTRAERGTQNVVLIYLPDGKVIMRPGPEVRDYLFAQIGADGKPTYGCATLTLAPGAALELPPPTPVTEER